MIKTNTFMEEWRLVIGCSICNLYAFKFDFKIRFTNYLRFCFNISFFNQVLNRTLIKCMPKTQTKDIQPCPYFEFQGFLR